jgi:hypothetical protein
MTVKIACVVFDCRDALVVGRFWSAAIGRPLDPEASSEFASIGFHGLRDRAGWGAVERDADPTWLFARVPESKTVKNRLHLDVIAADRKSRSRASLGSAPLASLTETSTGTPGPSWLTQKVTNSTSGRRCEHPRTPPAFPLP